jgi:hypothetical protein
MGGGGVEKGCVMTSVLVADFGIRATSTNTIRLVDISSIYW